MIDLATEKRHLAQADRDIAAGETRVSQQTELIQRLRKSGTQGMTEAERLLHTLEETLQVWRDHRATILRTIADMEQAALPSGPALGL